MASVYFHVTSRNPHLTVLIIIRSRPTGCSLFATKPLCQTEKTPKIGIFYSIVLIYMACVSHLYSIPKLEVIARRQIDRSEGRASKGYK